jgi:hypothetical protein
MHTCTSVHRENHMYKLYTLHILLCLRICAFAQIHSVNTFVLIGFLIPSLFLYRKNDRSERSNKE